MAWVLYVPEGTRPKQYVGPAPRSWRFTGEPSEAIQFTRETDARAVRSALHLDAVVRVGQLS